MSNPWIRVACLLLITCLLPTCGGGGDGGDGSLVAGSFIVSTEAGSGGAISPASQRVARGDRAVFAVVANKGFDIAEVTGCGGNLSGGAYTTGPIEADCVVRASFVQGFVIRGIVSGLEGSLGLTLELAQGSEEITVTNDAADVDRGFSFSIRAQTGDTYEVSVSAQPAGQVCTIVNGFGEVAAGGAEAIAVSCVSTESTANISGAVFPTAGISVDSDVNDLLVDYVDNSTPSLAQEVHNRVTLHGFASAEPTNGSTDFERFAANTDQDDFFQAFLQAGQTVQLQVVDFEGFDTGERFEGDLDLYLWDEQGNLIAVSESITEFEQVLVPLAGTYLINVSAFSGISKYVLRMAPPAVNDPLQGSQPMEFVPNQMIVKLKPQQVALSSKTQAFQGLHFKHREPGRATLVTIVDSSKTGVAAPAQKTVRELKAINATGYARAQTLRAIKAMRGKPGVVYAEPNYLRYPLRTPNDPGYWYQWHYDAIKLPQAWEITTGGAAGEGPIVAVIDTGVFLDHPDLAGQLIEGYDFISDPANARDGDGIDANADDPGDTDVRGQSSWHGTHVAGTVAAASNNVSGVSGIAWGARVMPVRVLGVDGGTSYDVIQGLRYAAGLSNDSGSVPAQRADVANLSLGGSGGSLAEQEAYREARNTGMIIVAAAGNESSSAPSYPAAYDGVVSVSATDYLNQLAPYSNFGDTIDLAAPGGNLAADNNGDGYPDGVLSTLVDDTSGERAPSYVFYHGTSMAAPHVTGVIALMKAVYPALSPDDFRNLLQSGALTDDLGSNGRDNFYGYGLINALKSVESAQRLAAGEPPPAPPPQVVATPVSVNLGLQDSASVTLSNEGGGDPVVTDVSVEDGWLTVAADNTGENGLGSYIISADRTGLEDGHYSSAVVFNINTEDQVRVQVFMQVGMPAADAVLSQLYVLLVDADSEAVIESVVAERVGSAWHYRFSDVPLGRYYIIAGSDIDVDDIICQSGESCGAYPTLNNQQPVEVQGQDISDLDFVANILGGFPTTSSYPAGEQHLLTKKRARPMEPDGKSIDRNE